jgi:predicted enzyme related to lactoylglutathione lyase
MFNFIINKNICMTIKHSTTKSNINAYKQNAYIYNAILKPATIIIFTFSFAVGYATNAIFTKDKNNSKMKKVTGIGGIFFKSKDPKATTAWYQKYLGLDTNPYGATFEWYEQADSATKAQTQWTPFAENTKYFEPGKQEYMINYRVENLEALVAELKSEGVQILDDIAVYDYGKFVHILDNEGNKVELWQET